MHRGNPQSQRIGCAAYLNTMKTKHEKALTFGEFIMAAYDTCGKRRARGILRLAAEARLIVFQEQDRLMISQGKRG